MSALATRRGLFAGAGALLAGLAAAGLNGQYQRVKRDPILSEGMCVIHMPFGRGGAQEAACLKLDLVNGWLFTIDSSRIKDADVREKVLMYQRECYGVLYAHFTGRMPANARLPEGDPDLSLPVGERRKLVTEARQSFGTSASRALWLKVNLPNVMPMFRPDDEGPGSQPDLLGVPYRTKGEEAA